MTTEGVMISQILYQNHGQQKQRQTNGAVLNFKKTHAQQRKQSRVKSNQQNRRKYLQIVYQIRG